MAGIRWGRGFLRVWMVLAVAWLAFIGLLQAPNVLNPYVPAKIIATPAATMQLTLFDTYGAEHEDLDRLVKAGESVETEVRPGYTLFTRTTTTGEIYDDAVVRARALVDDYVGQETVSRRSKAVPGLIGLFLVPPIVLLIIGAAIGWAISGFRRGAT